MVVLGRHFQTRPECVEIAEVLESRFHIPVRLSGTLSDPDIQIDECFAPGVIGVLSAAQNSAQDATLLKERQKYFWLSTALRSAADGIVIVNPEGRIQYLNPVAEHLTGCKQREAFGRNYAEVLLLEYRGAKLNDDLIGLATLNAEPLSLGRELILVSRTGRRQQVEGEISAASGDCGALGSTVFTLRDITQRKWEENQQRHEQAIRAVERLAETTAHTLNNLLTSILGNSDLLLNSRELSDEHRENARQVHTAAQNVAAVVRQLSKISRAKLVTRREVNLNELIEAYLPVLSNSLSPGIVLTPELEPAAHKVSADPEQVEQILFNLVANCRDAIPSTGQVKIVTQNVVVDASERLRTPRHFVAVRVCDNGEGMTPETSERIFEPFFTLKKDRGHVGLGLSIVQGIVRDYQGFLDVKSEVGSGTEVTFALPAIEADPYAYLDHGADRPAPSTVKTILVVEDDHAVRQLIRKILERNEYQVIEAQDGEDALMVAELHDGRVDVLVTDVMMPGITGPDLVRQFARLHQETKFLLISGFSADKIGSRASLPAGFKFLSKPFNQSELLGQIKVLLADPAGEVGTDIL